MTHFDPKGQDYLDEFDLGDKQELDHNDVGLGAFVTKKVEELHEVWQTEVNAPEILTYKKELVELIQKKPSITLTCELVVFFIITTIILCFVHTFI